MLTIIIIAMIQAAYDFAGWFGVIKENPEHKFAVIFRILKEMLDFIALPLLLYFYFGLNIGSFAAFFIAKWLHLCDSFYNVYRWIFTGEMVSGWGYWRWWTPLGLLRTNFWGFCVLKGFTEYEHQWKLGHWRDPADEPLDLELKDIGFSRGMVSTEETWIQTCLGLILAGVILQFWA